ncbi:endonuclease/exonuclease/phosphatase family protein [Ferrimonas balearica]|uniref:endonuclease/exonuclease/phosphatase family protein n=1 Tax=Ferrimonas balearica TaxID=44012 RepID=UPI001C967133|nr:endonuclease/exonuclease/phosphatase family protein [Ferrimonas balearica]MBY6223493.1 endonuclease/exonuclease/phosphatase family protein [Ferrimonas balearica]
MPYSLLKRALLCLLPLITGCESSMEASSAPFSATTVKVATFNVSMEAGNYTPRGQQPNPDRLRELLANGDHPQIRNIAEILQRVRPDIVLLNEFDYIADRSRGVDAFRRHYLMVSQQGREPLDYPYAYTAPVNTGVPSPFDIDGDGIASGTGGDSWGYGLYPGQYGMVVLSRYPIDTEQVRQFRTFLWHRMPDAQPILNPDGSPFYDDATWRGLRLSSKSHWDVPINVNGQRVHLLAAHPTPPVFDGPEDRNGARNHDEIRLWADYLNDADYLEDDAGQRGGLAADTRFVIVGDYNASPSEGQSRPGAINQLLNHPRVNASERPRSTGGELHSPDNPNGPYHTAYWRAQVDYVLPSAFGFEPVRSGVFWPVDGLELSRLIADRNASSDHRLVWMELRLTEE